MPQSEAKILFCEVMVKIYLIYETFIFSLELIEMPSNTTVSRSTSIKASRCYYDPMRNLNRDERDQKLGPSNKRRKLLFPKIKELLFLC